MRVAINDQPIVLQTQQGIDAFQLAAQVAEQFNHQWQQGQYQQQGKSASVDLAYPHIVDFHNVILEELQVTIQNEPFLHANFFPYPAIEPPPCPGDFNDDRLVNLADLSIFAAVHWLSHTCGPPDYWCGSADMNRSGADDLVDFALFTLYFGNVCPDE